MGTIHEVAKTDEIEPGTAILVEVDGKEIALFNLNGEFYAISNECSHVGGPLCEGDIEGDKVICPWHGAEFDIKSGESLCDPAEGPVESYKVHIEGDNVKIEL
jgi:nitrite reductase/ring-hydroxylating ferredoxin subunit